MTAVLKFPLEKVSRTGRVAPGTQEKGGNILLFEGIRYSSMKDCYEKISETGTSQTKTKEAN